MVHCAYIKRRPILSSNPFPWKWRVYIPSIVYVNKPCIFDSKYFCVFVGGWTAKIGGVEYLFFMKVKISQSIFEALRNKNTNDYDDSSAFSIVYIGNKVVKKIPNDGKYSFEELLQYDVMSQNPDIFPKTTIKKLKNGSTVVIQEKLNTALGKKIYEEIQVEIESVVASLNGVIPPSVDDELFDFRKFLEDVAMFGISQEAKKYFPTILKQIDKTTKTAKKYFYRFYEIANEIHKLKLKFPRLRDADLHSGNFGVDGQGILKIFDFQNVTSIGVSHDKRTKPESYKEKRIHSTFKPSFEQLALLFDEKFNLGFYGVGIGQVLPKLDLDYEDIDKGMVGKISTIPMFFQLTNKGKNFINFLKENIPLNLSSKSEKNSKKNSDESALILKYVMDDMLFLQQYDYIKKLFDNFFPSSSSISKKQFLYFIEKFLGVDILIQYKSFEKDLFNKTSPSIRMSELNDFFEELAKFGLPINMVEAKQ